MSKAEAFRANAAECDKKADQAKDIEAKRMFREAAENWRSMAAQAERHECASMRRMVLIVEDEALILVLAVSVLQAAGYDTVSASTVAEAVAIIEDPEQNLDLLFTDLGLANQADGGLAVGQTMAKSRPGLPVVYTTGRGVTEGIVEQFVQPSRFIPKPYTDQQLVSAAADLLYAQT
jgi:DNA-binding NtrC family response regulator